MIMEDTNIEYANRIIRYAHGIFKDNEKFNCVKCNEEVNITFKHSGLFKHEYKYKSCELLE